MAALHFDYEWQPGHGYAEGLVKARNRICFGDVYTRLYLLSKLVVHTPIHADRRVLDCLGARTTYSVDEFASVFAALRRAGIDTILCDGEVQTSQDRYEGIHGRAVPCVSLHIPTDQSTEAIHMVLNTLRIFQEPNVDGVGKHYLRLLEECPDEHPLNLLLVAHQSMDGSNAHSMRVHYEPYLFLLHEAEWWQKEIIESKQQRYSSARYLPSKRCLDNKIRRMLQSGAPGPEIMSAYRMALTKNLEPEHSPSSVGQPQNKHRRFARKGQVV